MVITPYSKIILKCTLGGGFGGFTSGGATSGGFGGFGGDSASNSGFKFSMGSNDAFKNHSFQSKIMLMAKCRGENLFLL